MNVRLSHSNPPTPSAPDGPCIVFIHDDDLSAGIASSNGFEMILIEGTVPEGMHAYVGRHEKYRHLKSDLEVFDIGHRIAGPEHHDYPGYSFDGAAP